MAYFMFRSGAIMRCAALLSLHRDREFGADDLAAMTSLDQTNIAKALGVLERDGVVGHRQVGRKFLYSIVQEHPLFPEIRSIAVKTLGGHDEVLAVIREDVDVLFAAIFGSFAREAERPSSDIDVLFVITDESGTAKDFAIAVAMSGVGRTVGRSVNPSIYTLSEFRGLRRDGNEAIAGILAAPMLILKGDLSAC